MQRIYGEFLYVGDEISKNEQLSFVFTLAAARQDDTDAMLTLGGMYYNGIGCQENAWTSVDWFEKAVDKGRIDAEACRLGGAVYSKLIMLRHYEYTETALELLETAVRG